MGKDSDGPLMVVFCTIGEDVRISEYPIVDIITYPKTFVRVIPFHEIGSTQLVQLGAGTRRLEVGLAQHVDRRYSER